MPIKGEKQCHVTSVVKKKNNHKLKTLSYFRRHSVNIYAKISHVISVQLTLIVPEDVGKLFL